MSGKRGLFPYLLVVLAVVLLVLAAVYVYDEVLAGGELRGRAVHYMEEMVGSAYDGIIAKVLRPTPTLRPTDRPTPTPTDTLTLTPTDTPTPTLTPTDTPTATPTTAPTDTSTATPTDTPTPTNTPAATTTPTDSPTTTPTDTSTPTLTSTSTPTDTPTPTNTATPKPTDTPTPTPTPTCRLTTDGQLINAWDRGKLGCPTAQANVTWAAWQPFERGYMVWRSDTRRVIAFYEDRTWTEFLEQWTEGEPIPSRGTPPPGLMAPIRGFGYIWGIHDEVASRLGWALEEEKGFCANIQSFERGFAFRDSTARSCLDQMLNEPRTTHPNFAPLFWAVYGDETWRRY